MKYTRKQIEEIQGLVKELEQLVLHDERNCDYGLQMRESEIQYASEKIKEILDT